MAVVLAEKEAQWARMVEHYRHVVDKRGRPIDEGILETVVVLNLLGIHTCASCEGHLQRGFDAPWIDIQDPDGEENEKAIRKALSHYDEQVKANILSPAELGQLYAHIIQLRQKSDEKYLGERYKLMGYLVRFYENRHSSYERTLIIRHRGGGSGWLESQGAYFQRIASAEQRAQKLAEYQEEMQAFTAFLKELFFYESDDCDIDR